MNHDKIYEAFPMDVSTEDGKRTAAVFAYIWTVHFLQQTEIRSKFLQATKIQPV